MEKFQTGTVLESIEGIPIVIESFIAEGGQGDVYKVSFGGQTKALKWYHKSAIKDKESFYENLENNVSRGKPSDIFLWPEAIAKERDGRFGYVMDLIPEGYKEFTKFLTSFGGGGFKTFKAVANVALEMISAFRILHNNGYCYQDLSDGNFFINPKTGKVLVCDNDNVAPNGTYTGILGTPRYMAPEIVRGDAKPSLNTDEFSLAVILFLLLFTSHPLEGGRWGAPCLTSTLERKLYGDEPIFIFDEQDDRNRPIANVHVNVLNRWKYMPDYLKEAFSRAFSKTAMLGEKVGEQVVYKRVKEFEWIQHLVRFQSEIVSCPSCSNEIFIQDTSDTPCDRCGHLYQVRHSLTSKQTSVTAANRTIIYRCQLGTCNPSEALNKIVVVMEKNDGSGKLALKNMTNTGILAISSTGKTKLVEAGQVMPFIPGVTLKVYDKELKLK